MGVATRIIRTPPQGERPAVPERSELHYTDIVAHDLFGDHVTTAWADDPLPEASQDFVWAMQWMHHQGSIAAGLEAAQRALRLLRPGGLLVITTELNLRDDETLDNAPTVLFQRRHLLALTEALKAEGHGVARPDFDIGADLFDRYVDVPPFGAAGTSFPPEMLERLAPAPHLKVLIDGFPCTSFGLVVRAAG
jgi:SAM-dependent methyltransferase